FTRTAAEIGLASGHTAAMPSGVGTDGPVAPTPVALPRMARLSVPGLFPLPVGGPGRFMVGAPLPLASTVSVSEHGLRVDAVANLDARYWDVTPSGLVRIAVEEGAPDGLSPVLLDGPGSTLGFGRI